MSQTNVRFSNLEEQTTVFEEDTIFDTQQFNERLVASVRIIANQAMIAESKEEQRKRTVAKLISATNKKPDQEDDTAPEAPIDPATIKVQNTFFLSERHTNTTSEDLSERWSISVAQVALTLKATTQRLRRSALMPLRRRYRAYRMFGVKRLNCMMETDTLDARVKSIHGQQYCQVFGNKDVLEP